MENKKVLLILVFSGLEQYFLCFLDFYQTVIIKNKEDLQRPYQTYDETVAIVPSYLREEGKMICLEI